MVILASMVSLERLLEGQLWTDLGPGVTGVSDDFLYSCNLLPVARGGGGPA